MSAYSHLEQALYGVCCELHRHRDSYPALEDVAEPGKAGNFQSKPFLEKLDPQVFDGSAAWPAIERYNRIRNWIVHRGRELTTRRYSETRKAVSQSPLNER